MKAPSHHLYPYRSNVHDAGIDSAGLCGMTRALLGLDEL